MCVYVCLLPIPSDLSSILFTYKHNRLDSIKATTYRSDRLKQATWSAFLGYIIALRTERIRREHRQTAVAVAHHR